MQKYLLLYALVFLLSGCTGKPTPPARDYSFDINKNVSDSLSFPEVEKDTQHVALSEEQRLALFAASAFEYSSKHKAPSGYCTCDLKESTLEVSLYSMGMKILISQSANAGARLDLMITKDRYQSRYLGWSNFGGSEQNDVATRLMINRNAFHKGDTVYGRVQSMPGTGVRFTGFRCIVQ